MVPAFIFSPVLHDCYRFSPVKAFPCEMLTPVLLHLEHFLGSQVCKCDGEGRAVDMSEAEAKIACAYLTHLLNHQQGGSGGGR